MLSCGTSKQAAGKSSQQPPPYPEDAQMTSLNPEKKSIINLAMDFHHIQLLLRKGRKIMIPDRQLHEDPVAWGADSLDFQPNRWLKNVLSKRNACFKPFGGVIAVSSFVDLNQVILSPTQLPPIDSVIDSIIDSIIDSVTYPLFPLPPPYPLLVLISYTFPMYI